MLGIFDSGFGGLTVLKPIHDLLPSISTVYLGDNARAPYGTRSHEEIYKFALEGTRFLFSQGCQLVILACNTASAQALRQIQQEILPREFPDRRVLGVIRPTVEEVIGRSRTGHIGVFATPATVRSNAYIHELDALAAAQGKKIHTHQVACPGLTDLVEQGRHDSDEAHLLVQKYVGELLQPDTQIDQLLLGCTHYPLMLDTFRLHVPSHIAIITQGKIVADKLKDYLARHQEIDARLEQTAKRHYFTTGIDKDIENLAAIFYGSQIEFEVKKI